MKIILWSLCAYGMSQIIVDTSTFDWLKSFFKKWILTKWIAILMNCMICTGAWVGFGLGAFFYSPIQTEFQLSNFWISIFLDGMLSSVMCWFLHLLELKIQKK